MFERLQQSVNIGSLEIKNRFVVPPMGTNFGGPDGAVTDQLISYYTARAKGGFGLIIVEVTAVDPLGKAIPNELGLWSDDCIPGMRRLVDSVHKHGARIAVQLHHAGRQTSRAIIGAQPVAPSPVACPVMREIPRELSTEETETVIDRFRDAAVRAREAGFDAVEIHGAHGYLIAQYMSASTNKRLDAFGGNFASRMRFPLEIIDRTRAALGREFPLLFRVSADEKVHGGRSIAETKAVARLVEAHGIDAVHVSICTYGSLHWMFVPGSIPPGFNVGAAEEIKKSVSIPVITVGRINDPYLAEDIIASGKADLVAFGRESLADPELPNKVRDGDIEGIAPCIACLQGCVGYLFNPAIQKISCLVNPFTGKEGTHPLEAASVKKKVMVVGGGPGGLLCAWVAAKRGHDVTCYEKNDVLGGQFRLGGIPPTKQDIITALKYYVTMGRKYGVRFRLGQEVTPLLVAQEQPDVVVLATGGLPLRPAIPGIGNPRVLDAIDVLGGKQAVDGVVLVVGGGMVGAETADFLGEQGCRVTILEMDDAIAKAVQPGPRLYLLKRLEEHRTTILVKATVTELRADGVTYRADGTLHRLEGFDAVVLALGATAHNPLEAQLRGLVKEVHVLGDALKARTAIDATQEAAAIAVAL
jgi:2,4-dienoyl-CoA reductase-like NADH-dependent reductase (Old Yellow Enzyme family)/thioredoxin reductase